MTPTQPSAAGAPIRALPTSVTGFVGAADSGPVDTPVTVTSAADFHATFGPSLGADRPLGHAGDLFFANGGTSAIVVRAAGPAPEQLVPEEGPGGVHALDGSGVTVLVLPGLTAAHHAQVSVALSRCAAYGAVLLLDLPPGPWGPETEAAVQQVSDHRERAAAYHPWVVSGGVTVPPSGAVAGVVARTDAERGVWKAPAGVELCGVDGLVETLDASETDRLTQAGVNVLGEFPGRGRLVWGARTTASGQTADPALRYLPVRRLTDHVLGSLTAGLRFVEDETSDAALWARVRQLSEAFLHDLWRRGGLQGATPEQAYGVRCGPEETMTEADMLAGQVVVSVWLAPVRPAEFDVHTLRLRAGMPSQRAAAAREPVAAAQAPVLTVDLGQVVSRYIGETEKNLARLFDRAEQSGQVLVFDKADALFGTRTSVRDAHDRYANQEVSHLVERMARERGVEVRWQRRKGRGWRPRRGES
ncbi:phage tail sheath family protein [Ornithinimicrobium sediminis]|uniref:phage tail sheath family protein n=1 Tax=Ornithinimicrobium sediminis TaxID=2904603 RepID=UPI001E405B62|nr:phage tail sheath subtilisin-like domain-containing protein [Ornithinimicrobium sediminis]MCE0488294.1 phage tail sheath subtilisin-like domain-containing protein [Ornithinimicrobium sediminis]